MSKNEETKVTTELQLLDSKRKFLDQLIKEIREAFTHLFQTSLKSIEEMVEIISDTAKDAGGGIDRGYQADMAIGDGNESSKHS